MQKTYCDVCKQEINFPGVNFAGDDGKVHFSIVADLDGGSKDLCLPCVIKSIIKVAGIKTKRKYTKPVKVPNTGGLLPELAQSKKE